MPQIRYTVSVNFPNDSIAPKWLEWLKNGHVADVVKGGATSAHAVKIDGSANLFEVVYLFPSREAFERYERDFAPALRAEGQKLFPAASGIVYSRTVAEVLSTF
jgi:hypothetical protein